MRTADVHPLYVRLPADVYRALKVRSATEGTSIQDIVLHLLRRYLRLKPQPKRRLP
jgi:plasmid stability protein